MKLHLSIIWVKSSVLFQNYKIFEDMHHGITQQLDRLLERLSRDVNKVIFKCQQASQV